MLKQRLAWVFTGVLLIVQGCSTTGPQRSKRLRGLSPEQQTLANATCFDGVPIDRQVESTELVVRQGYVLEHSAVDKIPLWVCESVTAEQLTGHVVRRNVFRADPDLKGPKANPEDYKGSGYDRGHQAPAGNQTVDPVLKDQTFYMSNMAPQRPSLNRGIWKMLEDKTRDWVSRYGHAYEWTGPIRCNKETCPRETIGPSAITVPLYFYKIILVEDQSKWKAIAFVLPNIDFTRPFRLEQYVESIEWIERRTGIEFMPNLPAADRRALKSSVSAMWP